VTCQPEPKKFLENDAEFVRGAWRQLGRAPQARFRAGNVAKTIFARTILQASRVKKCTVPCMASRAQSC